MLCVFVAACFALPRHIFKKRAVNLTGLFMRGEIDTIAKSVAKKLFETRTQFIRSALQAYFVDVLSIAMTFGFCFVTNHVSGNFFLKKFDFNWETLINIYQM